MDLYSKFCSINHIPQVRSNESELKEKYGIGTRFLTESWIIQKYKTSQVYYIKRSKIDIFLKLLMKNTSSLTKQEIDFASS